MGQSAPGQRRPGRRAFKPRVRPVPKRTMISSFGRPPEPRLPRAWSSPVRCAGGRTRTRPRSPRIAAASRTKGLAPGEGLRIAPPRSPAAAGRGPGGLSSCAPPSPIPEEGKAGVPGGFYRNSEGGAGGGRAGWSSRAPPDPGDPGPAEPFPACAPPLQCASPVAWPWPSGPCANPATRVGDGGWRGPQRAGRSPPLLPRPVPPPAPPPGAPQRCLYLPPPPPPSHRRYPWHGDPAQLRASMAASRPSGVLAAERSLGAEPCEFGGGGKRRSSRGWLALHSPYSPFNSLALSCSVGSRPSSFAHWPLASGSGVPRWPPPPPLQLSPVIPPLCYPAADPLTSPSAGALPPSLIDSSRLPK